MKKQREHQRGGQSWKPVSVVGRGSRYRCGRKPVGRRDKGRGKWARRARTSLPWARVCETPCCYFVAANLRWGYAFVQFAQTDLCMQIGTDKLENCANQRSDYSKNLAFWIFCMCLENVQRSFWFAQISKYRSEASIIPKHAETAAREARVYTRKFGGGHSYERLPSTDGIDRNNRNITVSVRIEYEFKSCRPDIDDGASTASSKSLLWNGSAR